MFSTKIAHELDEINRVLNQANSHHNYDEIDSLLLNKIHKKRFELAKIILNHYSHSSRTHTLLTKKASLYAYKYDQNELAALIESTFQATNAEWKTTFIQQCIVLDEPRPLASTVSLLNSHELNAFFLSAVKEKKLKVIAFFCNNNSLWQAIEQIGFDEHSEEINEFIDTHSDWLSTQSEQVKTNLISIVNNELLVTCCEFNSIGYN